MLRLFRVTQLWSGRGWDFSSSAHQARGLKCSAAMGQTQGSWGNQCKEVWLTPTLLPLIVQGASINDLLGLAWCCNSWWGCGELVMLDIILGTWNWYDFQIWAPSVTIIHAHTLWSRNSASVLQMNLHKCKMTHVRVFHYSSVWIWERLETTWWPINRVVLLN